MPENRPQFMIGGKSKGQSWTGGVYDTVSDALAALEADPRAHARGARLSITEGTRRPDGIFLHRADQWAVSGYLRSLRMVFRKDEYYRAPCWTRNGTDGAECGRANVRTEQDRTEVRCIDCLSMMWDTAPTAVTV